MVQKSKIIVCGCGDISHNLIFTKDDEQIWLHYQLEKKSLFERIVIGAKYIFGFQSRFGMYGELLIDKTNISNFKEIVEYIENNNGQVVEP